MTRRVREATSRGDSARRSAGSGDTAVRHSGDTAVRRRSPVATPDPPGRRAGTGPAGTRAAAPAELRFHHGALLYSNAAEYLAVALPFVTDGLSSGEAVLVVVPGERLELLRDALGGDAGRVAFADMAEVGRNPACIIPVWHDFVGGRDHQRRVRGIGEAVWPGRTDAELGECSRHEALLHLAFAAGPAWRLLCAYDASGLADAVLDEARRNHEVVAEGGVWRPSPLFDGAARAAGALDGTLPEPAVRPDSLAFGGTSLRAVRELVADAAEAAGIGPARRADLVLAVNELATNSLRYGGGEGVVRVWRDGASLACEVSDRGRLDRPLAGRQRPAVDEPTGRGLWLVNQLCDLVQLRSGPAGTVVRVHMAPDR